jgi:ubiquinone/menaquinone biosynthesis C-methylase UbiE
MERERVRGIYDQRAPAYDRTVGFGERLLLGDFRERFGAELAGETLEVAIGSGLNLPYYSAAVTRAVGVDLSRGMLAQAARRAREIGRSISLIQLDAERLAFRDASFDTVAISMALCTVPHPERAIQELARVCRPSGKIVMLEHVLSPTRPIAWMEWRFAPMQERALGCHLTRETIETVRHSGLVIESERSRLWQTFRLVVARPASFGPMNKTASDR